MIYLVAADAGPEVAALFDRVVLRDELRLKNARKVALLVVVDVRILAFGLLFLARVEQTQLASGLRSLPCILEGSYYKLGSTSTWDAPFACRRCRDCTIITSAVPVSIKHVLWTLSAERSLRSRGAVLCGSGDGPACGRRRCGARALR